MTYSDLIVEAFMVLRNEFYNPDGIPNPYALRDKRSTQDDPLDEHISNILKVGLKTADCIRASGPLITPDLVLFRPELCRDVPNGVLRNDLTRIVGIEVKKIERTGTGVVARASGLDYNTTPPCGTIRVYDVENKPVDIRGFYLFVCQESISGRTNTYQLTAMVLCDGNVLNQDFSLYLSAIGERKKKIHLGSYKNGADRTRPMFIFANPLGAPELDHFVTLIHPAQDLESLNKKLGLVYRLFRSAGKKESMFYCYRIKSDIPQDHAVIDLRDPFPTPSRVTRTQSRGRFRLPVRVSST
ncbi:MAG: hypothetical protein AMJ45_05290 [Syntrophobacter sp. DG_60]|nr:MAG: hypothetical protein AMJ45_05290 [Syntrophobacter sp. DG_60]